MSDLPKTSWRPAHRLKIGDFTADPVSNELSGPAGTARLRPLIMDVLLRLAAARGEPVTRETLIDDVWPRRMVNDEVLSRAIAELRTLLDDDTKTPRYVETLPKIGYRLVATVSAEEPAASAVTSTPTLPAAPINAFGSRRKMFPVLAALGIALLVASAWLALRPTAKASPYANLTERLAAATTFTADPELEVSPRFSPEGKRVAFAKNTAAGWVIVIEDTATRERQLVQAPDAALAMPVFFPDGKRLAHWRRTKTDCAIVERNLATGEERVLVDCAARPQARFDLSPDGSKLVFAAQPRLQFPLGLQLLDIAAGTVQTLTAPEPGEGDDTQPRFSPDGARIAFFRGTQSHSALWMANTAAPHAPARTSQADGLCYGAAWLDNNALLVAADWLGFRSLNFLDTETGEARLLGARGARFPDVGRDGQIVFEHAIYRSDLWLSEQARPGEQARVLWPSTRYTNQPEFSPDGRRLVFVSNRDGSEGVFAGAVDNKLDGELKRLTPTDAYRYIRPHWSPDGRHIYAVRIAISAARPTEQRGLRIDPATGAIEVLTHLGTAVNDVRELADGKTLLVAELAGNAMRLAKSGLSAGALDRLGLPLVHDHMVTGNELIFTQPQMNGATRCRLDTLACAPLQIELGEQNRFEWTLAPDAVWYRRPGAPASVLVRHDLKTGKLSVHDYPPTATGTNLAASSDGRYLVVAREAPPSMDLMMVPAVSH